MSWEISPHFYSAFRPEKMFRLGFLLLAVTSYCHNALRENTPVIERLALLETNRTSDTNKTVNQMQVRDNAWRTILWPQGVPQKMNNKNFEAGTRKSKILGSLAFLAGLGVGGLAGVASNSVRNLVKYPDTSLALSLAGAKMAPYFAPLYEAYPYVAHPYIYPPYSLYPFLDPIRLQNSVGVIHNSLQNQAPLQSINQLDSPAQNNSSDNEKSDEEDKRVENESGEVVDDKKSNDPMELRTETDRNAEEVKQENNMPCSIQKPSYAEDNAVQTDIEEEDLEQDADGSIGISNRQLARPNVTTIPTIINTTGRPHHHHHHTTDSGVPNVTNPTPTIINFTTQPTTRRPTSPFPSRPYPATTRQPFHGYYGGNPQEIAHLELTTDSSIFAPEEYPSVNFNLPFDRPANFVPDEKYNYYPSISSYNPNQYIGPIQDEYYSNNYYRLLNHPVNSQTLPNGFRPIL